MTGSREVAVPHGVARARDLWPRDTLLSPTVQNGHTAFPSACSLSSNPLPLSSSRFTKRETGVQAEAVICLQQLFSSRVRGADFVPEGDPDNVWRHLWLSQRGGAPWVEARAAAQHPAQDGPQQRISQPHDVIVLIDSPHSVK